MELYLVTGGAGFIGGNLVRALCAGGQRVRVLDNLSTGSMKNLAGLPDVEFQKGDIRDPGVCREACQGADYVVHLAALVSVPASMTDPLSTHDINVTGAINLLKAAADAGARRFVYASSSAVYGRPKDGPVIEEDAGDFQSPYALSKFADEMYAKFFQNVYGLSCVGLRYFNVFGPRQDPNSPYAAVIPNFIKAHLDGRAPVINGDGGQTRDFIFVEDIAAATRLACVARLDRPEVFNIASGQSITVNTLAETLADLMGSGLKAIHGPERAGDLRHSSADVSKAGKRLGFKTAINLRDGLEKTVAWFRSSR